MMGFDRQLEVAPGGMYWQFKCCDGAPDEDTQACHCLTGRHTLRAHVELLHQRAPAEN